MIKNSPVFKSDIISLFKDSIQTLFNIQRGEERRTLLMFGQIFLIITSLMMIKPVSNSLFFTVIGAEKLPLAFLLTA
ncbi:hypothetical protein JW935_12925, partial [candidate division KSB1 bacterium]|nr:hypothetical protein [candidate division KSB1 bacterium]